MQRMMIRMVHGRVVSAFRRWSGLVGQRAAHERGLLVARRVVARITLAQVSGWGVYCYDFPLFPLTSCFFWCLLLVFRRSNTHVAVNSRRRLPSPAVPQCLQPV